MTIPSTPVAPIGYNEEGIASWYGEPYHGRRAANGEIYDMEKMTAAHPSLPFETWIRVRNLSARRDTEVRIIDRGPFVKGRIVDVSRAAARELDLLGPGTARVKLTVIDPPKSYERSRTFTVQVSTAVDKSRAEQLQRKLRKEHGEVAIRFRPANRKGNTPKRWRILVGKEKTVADANRLLQALRSQYPNAFVIPWDAE